jgi:hypothetical protein
MDMMIAFNLVKNKMTDNFVGYILFLDWKKFNYYLEGMIF